MRKYFFLPLPEIIGLTAHKNSQDLKLILPFLTMDANGVLRQTNLPYCNHWSSAKESPIPAGDQYFDRIVIYLLGLKTGNLQFAKYRCSIPLSRTDGQITSIMRVYYTSIFGQFVLLFFFVMISNNSDYGPLENIKHFCQKESFEFKDSGSHRLPPFYAPC